MDPDFSWIHLSPQDPPQNIFQFLRLLIPLPKASKGGECGKASRQKLVIPGTWRAFHYGWLPNQLFFFNMPSLKQTNNWLTGSCDSFKPNELSGNSLRILNTWVCLITRKTGRKQRKTFTSDFRELWISSGVVSLHTERLSLGAWFSKIIGKTRKNNPFE